MCPGFPLLVSLWKMLKWCHECLPGAWRLLCTWRWGLRPIQMLLPLTLWQRSLEASIQSRWGRRYKNTVALLFKDLLKQTQRTALPKKPLRWVTLAHLLFYVSDTLAFQSFSGSRFETTRLSTNALGCILENCKSYCILRTGNSTKLYTI